MKGLNTNAIGTELVRGTLEVVILRAKALSPGFREIRTNFENFFEILKQSHHFPWYTIHGKTKNSWGRCWISCKRHGQQRRNDLQTSFCPRPVYRSYSRGKIEVWFSNQSLLPNEQPLSLYYETQWRQFLVRHNAVDPECIRYTIQQYIGDSWPCVAGKILFTDSKNNTWVQGCSRVCITESGKSQTRKRSQGMEVLRIMVKITQAAADIYTTGRTSNKKITGMI